MARPIREIPTLKGEDARRFDEAIKANETKKIPKEDYDRAINSYNMIMSKSNIG